MKVLLICILVAAIIGGSLILGQFFPPYVKYSEGRDTLESFGDKTYQLIGNSKENIALYNMQYEKTIINNVLAYKQNENVLCIIGNNNYFRSEDTKTHMIYFEISLKTNALSLYVPSDSVSSADFVLSNVQQMIKDGNACVLSDFLGFSPDAQALFRSLE